MRSTRTIIIAALAGAGFATPLLADVLVVRAVGPSAGRYVAGRSLPDASRLVLQKGDQVVLLDARGTRTVSGPGTFVAAGTAGTGGSTLIALASNAADRRNRVGAVRNLPADGPVMRPNIFLIDVAAPGNVCIADAAQVTLWRGAAGEAGTSTIVASDGTTGKVAWIKGQTTQAWPAAVPIAAGRDYRITEASGAVAAPPVTISFQLLAQTPGDLQQLAKDLIAHGCKAQIDVMVATTSAGAVAG